MLRWIDRTKACVWFISLSVSKFMEFWREIFAEPDRGQKTEILCKRGPEA